MNRALKIIAIGIAGLLGLLVLLLALAASFDWNRAKPWINEKVSAATGREFVINGDLSLDWERPPEQQNGWRRLIPWPHFTMQDVKLGNPDWAKSGPYMADIARAEVSLNLLPLLRKTISIDSIVLTEPNLALEKSEDNKNNWTFPKKEGEQAEQQSSGWGFDVGELTIREGNVRYLDPAKHADAKVRIDTEQDGSMTFKLGGTFNDEPLSGGGKTGSLLALRESNVRYPVQAEVKVGGTTITADGTLTDPAHPSALEINLKILGASMADLFPLSGVVLPETPKFSTEGRVVGTFAEDRMRIKYENFKGRVGDSDIGGTLEYQQQEPRPTLRGEVVSKLLNLKDLGAIVGSGDDDNKKKKDEPKIPPGKVLPVSPFKTERWGTMDVQVQFTGKKIVRSEDLPIENLHTNVKLENGVLSLAPLDFGVAGGKLTAELRIDGSAEPAKARMKVSARSLKLKQLFPEVESTHASVGQLNGDAQLTAAGNSIAALLASMDGEVKSLISQGSVSKFVLEAAGLNVGSAVIAKLFGDKQVPLNCMAADLVVTDGVMQPRTFVLDTTDATIRVEGNINFREEQLNLTILPESKGIRLISLRSPLYVGGTFKNPDVGVDKGVIALKAGAATVLGTVAAPFAALLALINPGPGEEVPCGPLLAEAREKPKAPPPGKSGAARRQTRE